MRGKTDSIENIPALTITDLRKAGLLAPGKVQEGAVRWGAQGESLPQIRVTTDTAGEIPSVLFRYKHDGSPVGYSLPLRFVSSNLDRGGYYYFSCPVTGRSCRKLYFIRGRFVSRFAFRALYDNQRLSHKAREQARKGRFQAVSGA